MFSHKQCEMARMHTNRPDIEDKYINEEYANLKTDEKEKATRELWNAYILKNDLEMIDIYNISAKYFISEPVLFCLFKEQQSKILKS